MSWQISFFISQLNLPIMDDIHTHRDYDNNITTYVKNLRLEDILSGNFLHELKDAENKPTKYLSIGIHPWDLLNNDITIINNVIHTIIPNIITHPKVYAIGECGLDKCIDIQLDIQRKVFVSQIKISEDHNLPVIIHAVHTYNEIIELRKSLTPKQIWIIHGYSGNAIIAKKLVDIGCMISFGINYKSHTKLIETFNSLNKNDILFETDNTTVDIR